MHLFSKLDLDPHLLKKLDLDPHQVNVDPKHWLYLYPGKLSRVCA
jgi:hypothetical protein